MGDKKEILKGYEEKHRFWTDKAISQFGATTNLFVVIGLGFLAFLFGKNRLSAALNFDYEKKIDWNLFFFVLTIIAALFSVIIGTTAVLSRLHDLRLTRHTIWIRKQSFDKTGEKFDDDHIDISKEGVFSKSKNFLNTITSKKYFIDDNDIANLDILTPKFQSLRKRTLLLGNFSWDCLNGQIILLIFSLILYIISLL